MNYPEIDSYVPEAFFRDGKEGLACRECHEDFAVVAPTEGYRLLAARGSNLKTGATLEIPQKEQHFLEAAMSEQTRVAILGRHGILIACTELLPTTGLLPMLLPHGSPEGIAHCLRTLSRYRPVCSPALSHLSDTGRPERYYTALCEQLDFCERILQPDTEADFRLHCAHIAEFAGCRTDVTALPVGPLPLIEPDRNRWTAFLLCALLALRGNGARTPTLQTVVSCPGSVTLRLKYTPVHRQHGAYSAYLAYLSHPCFSDFSVTEAEDGLQIDASLCRMSGKHALRTLPTVIAPKFQSERHPRPPQSLGA